MNNAYAGALTPKSVNRPLNEDAYTSDNPEDIMVAKERWQIVTRLLNNSPRHKEYTEWVLDRFAGYSWAQIAERHKTTKPNAVYRVEAAMGYIQTKTRDTEF